MITFSAAMETTTRSEIPEWMREERYMYCDQSNAESYSGKSSAIWEKIKKVFS